jgi:predicted site-specific integrase-resolvase
MTLLNQNQVCEMLGVSKKTLASWRCKGINLKYAKLSRRSVLYPLSEVEAYIINSVRASTSEDLHRAVVSHKSH